jgi:hypothetical protein
MNNTLWEVYKELEVFSAEDAPKPAFYKIYDTLYLLLHLLNYQTFCSNPPQVNV